MSTPENKTAALASSQKPKGAESRIAPRRVVHSRCPVQVLVGDESVNSAQNAEGHVTDISTTGIGLHMNKVLYPGSQVTLVLELGASQRTLQAKVIWTKTLPTTNRVLKAQPMPWRTGLMFLPANEEEKKLLHELAKKL